MNRQRILDKGCVAAIMYLGEVNGPIGDGIINVIEDTYYLSDRPYILDIPYSHYVEADGPHYFVILPLSDNSRVTASKDGRTIYSQEDGCPLVLNCESGEVSVKITNNDDGSSAILTVAVKKGKVVLDSNLVCDMTIYE